MPDIWRFYFVANCRHARPKPKDKFSTIVCKDGCCMGFLVNTQIHPFILGKPELKACQVEIKAADYKFLNHNSYIDCNELYPFIDSELTAQRDFVNSKTKAGIKNAAKISPMLTGHQKKIISDSP